MTKFSVAYIFVCELMFAALFGTLGGALIASYHAGLRAAVAGVLYIGLAAAAIVCSVFLLRRTSAPWIVTKIFGGGVVCLSIWILYLAATADPSGDGGEIGVIGIAFLLFAGLAFLLLHRRDTHDYLCRSVEAVVE